MLEEYETKGNISSSVDSYRDYSSREEEGDCTGIIQIGALDECNPPSSRKTPEPTCLEGATRKATPTAFQQQDLFQPGQAQGEKDHFQKRSVTQILSFLLLFVGFVVISTFLGVKMNKVRSLKEDLDVLELSHQDQIRKAELKHGEMMDGKDLEMKQKLENFERQLKQKDDDMKQKLEDAEKKLKQKDDDMKQKLEDAERQLKQKDDDMKQKLEDAEKKLRDEMAHKLNLKDEEMKVMKQKLDWKHKEMKQKLSLKDEELKHKSELEDAKRELKKKEGMLDEKDEKREQRLREMEEKLHQMRVDREEEEKKLSQIREEEKAWLKEWYDVKKDGRLESLERENDN